jgi:hypothetical protein
MIKYYSRYLDDRAVRRRWRDPRLSSVRVSDLQAYLLRKGWKPVPPDRPYVLVFQEPVEDEDGPLYQLVPDSEKDRSYLQQVYELIAAVAEVEDRYAGDVLTDILQLRDQTEANGALSEQTPAQAVSHP